MDGAHKVTIVDVGLIWFDFHSMNRYVMFGLQEKVLKCVELIQDLSLNGGFETQIVPQSPDGVLDAACFTYKTDELTVGSSANSSPDIIVVSPEFKRRRQEEPSHSQKN